MRRRLVRMVLICTAAATLAAGAGLAAADPTASPPAVPADDRTVSVLQTAPGRDDLPDTLEANRRALRDRALQDVLAGERKAVRKTGSTVVRLGTKKAPLTRSQVEQVRQGRAVTPREVEQAVELSRKDTDRVFVLPVQFGNRRSPAYPDRDTNPDIPGPVTFAGPLRNTIPAPDRRQDNISIWRPDFSRTYYQNLYFGSGSQSVKSYYERQSSGLYSIDGSVNDWVTVPFNQARYGRSNSAACPFDVCSNVWFLVRDALNAWVKQQRAAGRTGPEIKAVLASYDRWDRNDHDGDLDFNEPDGYLDRLQIVHAGGDQAVGDPYFGEDAIWSHRWRAFPNADDSPPEGPADNPIGGTQIGNTGVWAADYTMQAENAGLAVFAHEYGHDLGLPDHYDTANPGDNPVNWWTLMGQSRVKARRDVGVGTRAADLGVWDKLQLGWLDYRVMAAGQEKSIELGPHEYVSAKPQALVVPLPRKSVPTSAPTPSSGRQQWWSGTDDDYASELRRNLTLPASRKATLTFQANFNIEDCGPNPCDYAFVEVDSGSGWRAIPGTITSEAEGNGIEGRSAGWVPAEFDLSPYAGRTIALRFRYGTNAGTQGADTSVVAGLFVDDIAVTADGAEVLSDGVEQGANGWSTDGFQLAGSSVGILYNHYYLASYRANLSYDRYLRTGPYHFGWPATHPNRVEFFPYQHGLLVNYWDTSQVDNNTSEHEGQGLVLPVDARPELLRTPSGTPWRGRIQTYDAPFSLRAADSMVLHSNGVPSRINGQPAQPLFDDTRDFWDAELPRVGVKTPKLGVTLRVTGQTTSTMTVDVGVSPGSTLDR